MFIPTTLKIDGAKKTIHINKESVLEIHENSKTSVTLKRSNIGDLTLVFEKEKERETFLKSLLDE